MSGKRICLIAAAESTVTAFLLEQVQALRGAYDVTVAVNTDDLGFLARRGVDAEVRPISIQRKIAPGRDIAAVMALIALFARRRFDAIHSITPKAGLLAMLAGAMARVPVRIHTFTGQVWATRTGRARSILKSADKVIASAATTLLADSPSQRDFLVSEGVVSAERIEVLGSGSISGVDPTRFRPDPCARQGVRSEHAIPESVTVFLFVGRLNRDKGVLDLAQAFASHAGRHAGSVLLVVGPDEEGLTKRVREAASPGRVVFVPFSPQPERYMAAADVLCLPSYREGFGTVVIEAAAAGVPAIASRIYGITDAVVDGLTGVLHAPGAIRELASAMDALASDSELRTTLGERAQARATHEFSCERVTRELMTLYARVLGAT